MMGINRNLYPSNTGYSFVEKDGSKHRSTGWTQLERVVREYRERNGFEVGNVMEEIEAQACVKNSNLCVDKSPRQIPPPSQDIKYANTIFLKLSNWLAGIVAAKRRREIRLVDKPEAVRRAAICANCPRQIGIPTVCGTCLSQLESFRRGILEGQPTVNKGLAACGALGEDLQVSVHLHLEPVDTHNQPPQCWRRTV
jgi:hypothetical protein